MENLEHVKAGDQLYWDGGYQGSGIVTVHRVTEKQIIIKRKYAGGGGEYEDRFWKKDGNGVGRDSYTVDCLFTLTPALLEKHQIKVLRKQATELREKLGIPQKRESLEKFIEALSELINLK